VETGFLATQFNAFTTKQRMMKRRVEKLFQFEEIDQVIVRETIEKEWPSPNGGVFVADPNSPVLPLWHKWTKIARSIFISDEVVLHTMFPKFAPLGKIAAMMGGAFNTSVKFQAKGLADADVRIWHFHGDSNTRPNKCQKAVDRWLPVYDYCIEQNIGNVQEWKDEITNKHLDRLLKSRKQETMWC
ncbi:unnamed protein product, partial [marine sediment metagenome]